MANSQSTDEELTPIERHGTWLIADTAGGIWWPNEAARLEIEASADPPAAALAMLQATPTRGTWHA